MKNGVLTPQQIAAVKAVFVQVAALLGINFDAVAAHTEVIEQLTFAFFQSISNPDFFRNPKRVDRLFEALKVPMFDDRSMQQFAVAAKDDLIKAAMELAILNQAVPVMPTDDEIAALALQKYEAKQAAETAKAAKNTKATTTTVAPVPAPPAEP